MEVAESTELPMVVWLNGNESYFEAFTLDADAVMAHLGLKRSRLTQISGKELRVGRAKMGRYIRPIYRPCDVEAYQAWVKPTATHKKSSSVIEEAVQHLETQTEVSIRQMQELLGSFSEQNRNTLGKSLAGQTRELLEGLHAEQRGLAQAMVGPVTHGLHRMTALEVGLGALSQQMDRLVEAQTALVGVQETLIHIRTGVELQVGTLQRQDAQLVALRETMETQQAQWLSVIEGLSARPVSRLGIQAPRIHRWVRPVVQPVPSVPTRGRKPPRRMQVGLANSRPQS